MHKIIDVLAYEQPAGDLQTERFFFTKKIKIECKMSTSCSMLKKIKILRNKVMK